MVFLSLPKYTIDVVFGSHWLPRRRELMVPQARWGFRAGLGRAGSGKPQTLEVCSGPTWYPTLGRCSVGSCINDAGTGLSYLPHCSGLSWIRAGREALFVAQDVSLSPRAG